MPNLTDKARAFLASKPDHIGTVLGWRFYEHPTRGDESPLVAITSEGKLKLSDWWDMPSTDELMDCLGLEYRQA